VGFSSIIAVFIGIGCGPKKSDVKGTITYKGEKVGGGSIQIQSASGIVVGGAVQSDGSYVVSGVPNGPAKVTVSWQSDAQTEWNVEQAKRMRESKDGKIPKIPDRPPAGMQDKLPKKYKDFSTSGLSVDVNGPTTYDIQLQD
jgi:hypothetical protein